MKRLSWLAAALLVVTTGCGRNGEQVTITMNEFAFVTSDTVFVAGRPYRFALHNTGATAHEWAVVPRGDTDEARMLFEVEEDDLYPGARIVRTVTFSEPGEYDFSCFMPGHYEGGMVLPVRVVAPTGSLRVGHGEAFAAVNR